MSTTSGSNPTKESEIAQATNLVAGMQKHLASTQSITLASVAYTPTQLTSDLQSLVTLYGDVATAKSVYQAKLAAEKAQAPALLSLMALLVSYVKLTFSASPDVLVDFGLQPKKAKTPLTAEQQMVAVAKRASTRKARGTMSKKAKKEIKGNVIDVALSTVTAGQPVVSSSPTPSAPTGSVTVNGTSHGA
jgi:hypothetical protein